MSFMDEYYKLKKMREAESARQSTTKRTSDSGSWISSVTNSSKENASKPKDSSFVSSIVSKAKDSDSKGFNATASSFMDEYNKLKAEREAAKQTASAEGKGGLGAKSAVGMGLANAEANAGYLGLLSKLSDTERKRLQEVQSGASRLDPDNRLADKILLDKLGMDKTQAAKAGLLTLKPNQSIEDAAIMAKLGVGGANPNTSIADATALRNAGILGSVDYSEKPTFFTSGAFKDGYQFGDIAKTILGTGTDIAYNFEKGVYKTLESTLDLGAEVAAYGNAALRKIGNEASYAELLAEEKLKAEEYAKQDLIDEEQFAKYALAYVRSLAASGGNPFSPAMWVNVAKNMPSTIKYIEDQVDEDSLLGLKGEGVAESAGTMAVSALLQSVGIPWELSTYIFTAGSSFENELLQGASFDEAAASSAIQAGSAILLNKLFGGDLLAQGGVSQAVANVLTKNMSAGILRTAIKAGVDVFGEGMEEALEELVSDVATALWKGNWEVFSSPETYQRYLDSAIAGWMMGGISTSIQLTDAKSKGYDYVSEMTRDEETVVNRLYQEQLAAEGKNVSQRKKNEIYNRILDDMENGKISESEFNRVLGRETESAEVAPIKPTEEVAKTEANELAVEEPRQTAESDQPINESFNALMAEADRYAPPASTDIAPASNDVKTIEKVRMNDGQKPKTKVGEKIRNTFKKTKETVNTAIATVGDKGWAVENVAKKAKNRDLEAKYNFMHYSEARAQEYVKNKLMPIVDKIKQTGKTREFFDYMYNLHNIDRMSLEGNASARALEVGKKFENLREDQVRAIAAKEITDKTTERTANTIEEARDYLNASKTKNKPVFGDDVTAEVSREIVAKYEAENPEFKELGQQIVDYNRQLRQKMVDEGIISQKTADLWERMYPNFVPIKRANDNAELAEYAPVDNNKTGVNAPIKRAVGGSADIADLFETMVERTEQTYKAISKNSFGRELKNTLESLGEQTASAEGNVAETASKAYPSGTVVKAADRGNYGKVISYDEASNTYSVEFVSESGSKATVRLPAEDVTRVKQTVGVDDVADGFASMDDLLQGGTNPSFTIFENGERVTFDIGKDIYDSLKPTNDLLAKTFELPNKISNMHRGLLTDKNPVFLVKNIIKDTQDVLFNSQHAAKTYANFPVAIKELASQGKWYQEYIKNGGSQNTYFDNETKTFAEEPGAVKQWTNKISEANEFVERVPRLAEYIASRKSGASIETAMLDAARVTTNFAAGADLTKFLNRNGFTFLNASVQGLMQNVRNVREANAGGIKGWAILASKIVGVGLSGIVANSLLWDDDEDYEDLSDYVKQNYFIIAKTKGGRFIRIPKGRVVAVVQEAFQQMENLITGDDEVDMSNFADLVIANLAPNNPIENNILAPIIQTFNNETWYGEDLVPTRLQDLPSAEQYDESTDIFSKWLGEKTNWSPYKINYLLNQYSGAIGDVFLPMLTPEAESGDKSVIGKVLAPWKDAFSTDPVFTNQNVAEFYDTADDLKIGANAAMATDEDILMNKYMNAVNSELGELYKQKREVQNSELPDDEKFSAVRDTQQQIVGIAKDALATYKDVNIMGEYANVGDYYFRLNDEGEWQKMNEEAVTKYLVTRDVTDSDYADDGVNFYHKDKNGEWKKMDEDAVTKYVTVREAGDAHYATNGEVHYRLEEGGDWSNPSDWKKISDRELERQNEVTKELGITPEEYWSKTDSYMIPMAKGEYEYAYDNPGSYAVAKAVGGYDDFMTYKDVISKIKASVDKDGKPISGSRAEKIWKYINSLNIDTGMKYILYKNQYKSDDSHNYAIIDYLNKRDDISYDDMKTILEQLGFEVDEDGNATW